MRPLPLCFSTYLFKLANNSKFIQVKGDRAEYSMTIDQAEGNFSFGVKNLGILLHFKTKGLYFSIIVNKEVQALLIRKVNLETLSVILIVTSIW